MKILLDNNLSPRLCAVLSSEEISVLHVADLGLDAASDEEIWQYAKKEACTIMTKDADFNLLLHYHGFPPKVIWLRLGNVRTRQVQEVFEAKREAIIQFIQSPDKGLLEVFHR